MNQIEGKKKQASCFKTTSNVLKQKADARDNVDTPFAVVKNRRIRDCRERTGLVELLLEEAASRGTPEMPLLGVEQVVKGGGGEKEKQVENLHCYDHTPIELHVKLQQGNKDVFFPRHRINGES